MSFKTEIKRLDDDTYVSAILIRTISQQSAEQWRDAMLEAMKLIIEHPDVVVECANALWHKPVEVQPIYPESWHGINDPDTGEMLGPRFQREA